MEELKPGGAQILVTESNKKEYLDLLAQYRLATSVKQEIEAFVKGTIKKDFTPRHKVFFSVYSWSISPLHSLRGIFNSCLCTYFVPGSLLFLGREEGGNLGKRLIMQFPEANRRKKNLN